MPRKGDPRIVIRLSPADAAVIEAAAESVGVAVGGLVRECAVRYAAVVAREVAAGAVKLRRSSSGSLEAGRSASLDAVGPDVQARGPGEPVMDPGVARALAFRRVTQR